ncbi:MAG TPA: SCO family protein [Gemmatimonadales bacterium]|nr:SCO family protein [Gemmatimonadales bacterium]
MTRREAGALAAFATIGAITAVWWALALWPLPGDAPSWMERTRAVCFGSVHNGLPTIAGWMVLIGQPVYMLATLWLISGHTVVSGVRALATQSFGRTTLGAALAFTALGLSAAGIRVARAAGEAVAAPSPAPPTGEVPRIDRPAPPLALVDQQGTEITLAQFRGRPVFVSFAFAHCETVCPLLVKDLLQAQALAAELRPVLLVVTLDPWRDPPARLPAIATEWRLGDDAHVLSGEVAEVERTLDAWQVGRTRDPRTGDVTHASVVYLLDRQGRIAFLLSGTSDPKTVAALARLL